MAQKTKTVDKWKRKRWYKIYAPPEFDRKEIGETPAEKPELVAGRTIKANAREISGQPKKGHMDIWFKITEVQGLNAQTKTFGLEVKPATMKRIVRRRSSKIDCVKDVLTKNGVHTRVKMSIITQRKTNKIKESHIRIKALEETQKIAGGMEFSQLVIETAFGDITGQIQAAVKNIAGIKRVEVMKIEQLDKKNQ